ncbi:MAG: mucoidy inhibitor MuiA family protein [bacterium]
MERRSVSREALISVTPCRADVYLSGSLVEYRGRANVKKGRNVLEIAGISGNADPSRVQMRFQGGVLACHILGIESLPLEENPEITKLQMKMRDAREAMEILDFQYQAWKKSVDGAFAEKESEKAAALLEALPERLLNNRKAYHEKEEELQSLQKGLEALEGEGAIRRSIPVLRAEIEAAKEGECPFSLTAEDDATWSPFYEITVDDISKPLTAKLRATVRLSDTGDWDQVSLKLIYGERNREGTKPTLRPWYLDFPAASNRAGGMPMLRKAAVMEDRAMAEEAMPMAFAGAAMAFAPAPKTEVVTEALAQYLLPGTYHLSKGNETVLDVLEMQIPAEYMYSTVPKLDPDVFLTATVEHPEKYSLLPCRAFVSYAGLSVGEVWIPKESSEEPFVLSLGRDEGILTRREKTTDSHSEAALSGKQVRKLAYTLHVTNRKEMDIPLEVIDQIPVSRDDKIRVTVQELSEGSLNADTGEVVWKYPRLKKGGSAESTVAFTVTWPKNVRLNLGNG